VATATLTAQLAELIAIPSMSADPAHAGDVRSAAEWICERVRAAGGTAELVDWEGRPLAIGEVRASNDAATAPTVLCYGHFDVQPPDPLELWESPPFELDERDGWLYGRGIADDKGQLFMLLEAARRLAEAGDLPVNVRFTCDGEEEVGGHSIVDFLRADERGADAAVIFDSDMLEPGRPAFNIAMRGLCYFHVTVRTGAQDLHSGVYGGAALNAMHALLQTLGGVLHRDGRAPEPLRAGIAPVSDEEVEGWAELPPGATELSGLGARPADARAEEEFYLRTWAGPSVDVHGIAGGSPHLQKTVLPVQADANVSIRLAPGQTVDEIAPVFERLLRETAPSGAEVTLTLLSSSPPGLVPPDSAAVRLAGDAFEQVVGRRPLLVRSGGSIPLVPALSARGIPAIVTGFALKESNIHSPNERLRADYLPLGVATAEELLRRFAGLR
jgi:acetylornithine deacetylase/succinyl-diaminopimelate desuccinylase-like protein